MIEARENENSSHSHWMQVDMIWPQSHQIGKFPSASAGGFAFLRVFLVLWNGIGGQV